MADTTASKNTVASGSFNIQLVHDIKSGLLEAAIADYEAIATTFAVNAISDDKVRQQYSKHIREISDQVRQEVANSNMTVKEGAEYCSQLRDKLFVEYRKYTSAVGVAKAEALKLQSRGFDHYLNKYAQAQFGKNFDALTTEERNAVYYTVLKKAGGAKDKVKEAARQGSIIAGGMIGGSLAGLAVSFVCGPAEPACAVALVFIGSNLGGMAAEAGNDLYQEELPVFMHWMND